MAGSHDTASARRKQLNKQSRPISPTTYPNVQPTKRGNRTTIKSDHVCSICNQSYSRKDNLRVHQRIHSGETPYECKYCPQRYRWMAGLRIHEKNHRRDGHPLRDPSKPVSTQPPARPTSRVSTSTRPGSRSASSVAQRPSGGRGEIRPSSRGSSTRPPSSSVSSRQRAVVKTSTSREPQTRPSKSRGNLHVDLSRNPLILSQDLVSEELPLVSPIFQEPWHDVLDDNRN